MTTDPGNYRTIRTSAWAEVRDRFTQPERDAMNAAIVARIICPEAGVVDLDKLPAELVAKLERELPIAARGRR